MIWASAHELGVKLLVTFYVFELPDLCYRVYFYMSTHFLFKTTFYVLDVHQLR